MPRPKAGMAEIFSWAGNTNSVTNWHPLIFLTCNGKGETLQAEHSSESSRAKILENCPNGGRRITLEAGDPQGQQSQGSVSTPPHCRSHSQSPYMLVTLSVAQSYLGGCYKPVELRAALRCSESHRWATVSTEMQSGLRCRKSAFPQHLPFTSPQSTGQNHIFCVLNKAWAFWRMNLTWYPYSFSNRTGLQIRPYMTCHKLGEVL